MTFSKIVLGFTGAVFALYGVYCGFDPDALAEITGLGFARPGGQTEARAMYGGLQLGFGLFLVLAAIRPKLRLPGLLLLACVCGCLALFRLIGLASVGADEYNLSAVVYELVTAALAALALRLEGGAVAAATG